MFLWVKGLGLVKITSAVVVVFFIVPQDLLASNINLLIRCRETLLELRKGLVEGQTRVMDDVVSLNPGGSNPLESLYDLLTPYQPLVDTNIIFIAVARTLNSLGYQEEAKVSNFLRVIGDMEESAQLEFANLVYEYLKRQLPSGNNLANADRIISFMELNSLVSSSSEEQVRLQSFVFIWNRSIRDGSAKEAVLSLVLALIHGEPVPGFNILSYKKRFLIFRKLLTAAERKINRQSALVAAVLRRLPGRDKIHFVPEPVLTTKDLEGIWQEKVNAFESTELNKFLSSNQFFEIELFIQKYFYYLSESTIKKILSTVKLSSVQVDQLKQRAQLLLRWRELKANLLEAQNKKSELETSLKLSHQLEKLFRLAAVQPDAARELEDQLRKRESISDADILKVIELVKEDVSGIFKGDWTDKRLENLDQFFSTIKSRINYQQFSTFLKYLEAWLQSEYLSNFNFTHWQEGVKYFINLFYDLSKTIPLTKGERVSLTQRMRGGTLFHSSRYYLVGNDEKFYPTQEIVSIVKEFGEWGGEAPLDILKYSPEDCAKIADEKAAESQRVLSEIDELKKEQDLLVHQMEELKKKLLEPLSEDKEDEVLDNVVPHLESALDSQKATRRTTESLPSATETNP